MNKLLWIAMVGGFVGSVYFTPSPLANESALHYILADDGPWQEWACAAISCVAGALLLLRRFERKL